MSADYSEVLYNNNKNVRQKVDPDSINPDIVADQLDEVATFARDYTDLISSEGISEYDAAAVQKFAPISVLASQSQYPVPQPKSTFVSTFQSGHGFTADTSPAGSVVDLNRIASDAVVGTQYVRVTTNGTTGAVTVSRFTGLPSVNITNKRLAILMRVSNLINLSGVQVYLYSGGSSSGTFSANYRVNRYINGRGSTMEGEWSYIYFTQADIIGSPGASFDPTNVTGFRVRVVDNGSGPVTLDLGSLAHFNVESISASAGIVTFTFDDGFISHRTKAAPLLAKRGWAATAFPICQTTIGGGANYMTVQQMRELQNLYRWEFGGHSYSTSMHNAGGYPAYTDAEISADILANIVWLQENGLKWSAMFAWPGGTVSQRAMNIVSRYYSLGRSSAEEPFSIALPDRPLDIRSISVNASRTGADYQVYIDKAVANKTSINFRFHDIKDTGASGGTEVLTSVADDLFDRVAASGLQVLTMGQQARAIASGYLG